MSLTHKQRAIMALEGQQPDYVPTFELAFQLTEEAFGLSFYEGQEHNALPAKDRLALCRENARLYLRIAERYEHSIIMVTHTPSIIFPQRAEELAATAGFVREIAQAKGEDYLIITHGDATFAIPQGEWLNRMIELMAEDQAQLHQEAENIVRQRFGYFLYYADHGFDGFALCDDYAFNANPFFSPSQFAEFVAPYLRRTIQTHRAHGRYTIKHTDGNIMPILDQIVDCGPHAVHSLDPQAGMDIARIKRCYGKKVALCGNVNCGLMQTGTEDEVLESCAYAMQHGKPGGGYIFCSSNCAFKGMPLARYELINNFWKKQRQYA